MGHYAQVGALPLVVQLLLLHPLLGRSWYTTHPHGGRFEQAAWTRARAATPPARSRPPALCSLHVWRMAGARRLLPTHVLTLCSSCAVWVASTLAAAAHAARAPDAAARGLPSARRDGGRGAGGAGHSVRGHQRLSRAGAGVPRPRHGRSAAAAGRGASARGRGARRKRVAADHKRVGVCVLCGELGPCEDALQDAGSAIGLCYGHYGEASDSIDDLLDVGRARVSPACRRRERSSRPCKRPTGTGAGVPA